MCVCVCVCALYTCWNLYSQREADYYSSHLYIYIVLPPVSIRPN